MEVARKSTLSPPVKFHVTEIREEFLKECSEIIDRKSRGMDPTTHRGIVTWNDITEQKEFFLLRQIADHFSDLPVPPSLRRIPIFFSFQLINAAFIRDDQIAPLQWCQKADDIPHRNVKVPKFAKQKTFPHSVHLIYLARCKQPHKHNKAVKNEQKKPVPHVTNV